MRPAESLTLPDELRQVKTMLSAQELMLLYRLARDAYAGCGEIVDGGAFLGGSTLALALGLRDNPRVEDKQFRIHSYDYFVADHFVAQFISGVPEGESTRPYYDSVIAPVASHVAVHEGDLADRFEQEVRGIDVASECGKKRGTGKADLPRNDRVKVAIGGVEGTFLVDETCGTTALTADFAKRAQVAPVQGPNIETIAAGAVRSARLAIATVTIGTAVAPDAELAIVDSLPDQLDGVLGLSVLWKFELVRREDDQGLTLEGSDL